MDLLKNKHWTEIGREPEGKEDGRKPGKERLWKKLEDVAKRGDRLRGWLATVRWRCFTNIVCSLWNERIRQKNYYYYYYYYYYY